MKKIYISIILFFLGISSIASAQIGDTLYLKDLLVLVVNNHPLIQKAGLYDEITEAYDLKGKGVLDPKIYSDFDSKSFDDKNYFNIWQAEAKIPTALPIDFSVGYEQNDGLFLNDENAVPSNGLVYGTLNVSLLRGLLFDEQRYNIKQAALDGEKSQIQEDILTREILFQAINAYVKWTSTQYVRDVNLEYLETVSQRHQNIIQLYVNGDIPAIDTLESRLNLNTANKFYIESRDKFIKARQKLSLFIWNANGEPLELNSSVNVMSFEPLVSSLNEMSDLREFDFTIDPLIRKYDNKITALELDNRLERENLKPQLDIKYNTIVNLGNDLQYPSFSLNDYKYGVTFQVPILNRKTRGELRLNESIIQQNELDRTQYLETLNNKMRGVLARQELQNELLTVTQEKVVNSQLLLEAEQLKFELGESSVFLLNKRELKLLESRLDLWKSYAALGMIYSDLYYFRLGQE